MRASSGFVITALTKQTDCNPTEKQHANDSHTWACICGVIHRNTHTDKCTYTQRDIWNRLTWTHAERGGVKHTREHCNSRSSICHTALRHQKFTPHTWHTPCMRTHTRMLPSLLFLFLVYFCHWNSRNLQGVKWGGGGVEGCRVKHLKHSSTSHITAFPSEVFWHCTITHTHIYTWGHTSSDDIIERGGWTMVHMCQSWCHPGWWT